MFLNKYFIPWGEGIVIIYHHGLGIPEGLTRLFRVLWSTELCRQLEK
jgi:hypothetical protein